MIRWAGTEPLRFVTFRLADRAQNADASTAHTAVREVRLSSSLHGHQQESSLMF